VPGGSDGSRSAIDALRRDSHRQELPVGVLFALDVHSAKLTGRDPKTGASRFELTEQGHLVRGKDERTLYLMQKVRPGSAVKTGYSAATTHSPQSL